MIKKGRACNQNKKNGSHIFKMLTDKATRKGPTPRCTWVNNIGVDVKEMGVGTIKWVSIETGEPL